MSKVNTPETITEIIMVDPELFAGQDYDGLMDLKNQGNTSAQDTLLPQF